MKPEKIQRRVERIKLHFPEKASEHAEQIFPLFAQSVFENIHYILEKTNEKSTPLKRKLVLRRLKTLFQYVFFINVTTFSIAEKQGFSHQNISNDLLEAIAFLWKALPDEVVHSFSFNFEDLEKRFFYSKTNRKINLINRIDQIENLKKDGLSDEEVREQLDLNNFDIKIDQQTSLEFGLEYPLGIGPGKEVTTALINELQATTNPQRAQAILDQLPDAAFLRNQKLNDEDKFLIPLSQFKLPFSFNFKRLKEVAEELTLRGVPAWSYVSSYNNKNYFYVPRQFEKLLKKEVLRLQQERPELFSAHAEVIRGPHPESIPSSYELLFTEKYCFLKPLIEAAGLAMSTKKGFKMIDYVPLDCPFTIYQIKVNYLISSSDATAFVEYLKQQ